MTSRIVAEGSVADIAALHGFAASLAEILEQGDLVILTGELGAGKTTFTRGLAAALGVHDTVSSPTFILARTHQTNRDFPLIHLDAYRLSSVDELDDLGLDYHAAITVAEWGKGMLEHEYDSWLELTLERAPEMAASVDTQTTEVDFSDMDFIEEPRRLRLLGFGDRWQGVELNVFGN